MSGPFALPAKLDLTTAGELADAFRNRMDEDLIVDASDLAQLGTPGLQVLLSARKSLSDTGHILRLENASGSICKQVREFGLDPADIGILNSAEES